MSKHKPIHGGEGNKAAGKVLKDIGNKVLSAGMNALTGGAVSMNAGLDARREREEGQLREKSEERGRLIEEEKRKAGRYLDSSAGNNDFLDEGELPAVADIAAKAGESVTKAEESGQAALDSAAAQAGSAARGLVSEGGIPAPETEAHTEAVRKVINGGGTFTAATLDKVPGNAANAEWHRELEGGGEVDAETFLNANNILNTLAKAGKPMPLKKILETLKDPDAGAALLEEARKTREGQPENERYAWRTVRDFAEPEAPPDEAPAEPEAPAKAQAPAENAPFRRDLNGARSIGMYGGATNAQVAAAEAGLRLYRIQKQRQEYEGALGVKLDNMAFDLKTQGTQLAASIQNMTPEKQRFELAKWNEKITQSRAYSPKADGISPQEREARERVINGVMRSVIGQVQSNSLERQRSQELADMQTRMDGVIADVSGGVYNNRPEEAYFDGIKAVNGAERHLSPQQYRAAVTGLYDGITSGLYGAVMGDVLKRAGGDPVDSAEELEIIMQKADGLARGGAGYLSGALGPEAGKVLLAKAAGFAAGARKQVADYNTGLLDAYNREYNTRLETGDPKAMEIAAEWRENRQKMINAGTITGEQEYKTRNYFGVAGKAGEGNGGAASVAKGEITGLQEFFVTGGAAGTSPEAALKAVTDTIQDTQTNPDGSPLDDWQARDLAVFHLADQWTKSSSFKDGDTIKQAYLALTQNLDDQVKAKGIDRDTAMKLTNDAYHVFWNGLFNMAPDSTPHQIEEKVADIAKNFYTAALPVFDSENSIDEDMKAGRNDIKELRTAVGKIRGMAEQMGIPPESLAKSQLMAGTYEGVVSAIQSHAADLINDLGEGRFIDVEPDALKDLITVRADEDTGGFRVSVNAGDRKSGGSISRNFDVKFDRRGRLVFADETGEYTLTGDGAYGKWRRPFEDAAVQREQKEDEAIRRRYGEPYVAVANHRRGNR
jgi:hypothetical protein